jgi:putative endonuclease
MAAQTTAVIPADGETGKDRLWSLYVLECQGGKLYSGITVDLERRFAQHCAGKGARYTRANPPLAIAGAVVVGTHSEAARAECAIKRVSKGRKIAFLDQIRAAVVPMVQA